MPHSCKSCPRIFRIGESTTNGQLLNLPFSAPFSNQSLGEELQLYEGFTPRPGFRWLVGGPGGATPPSRSGTPLGSYEREMWWLFQFRRFVRFQRGNTPLIVDEQRGSWLGGGGAYPSRVPPRIASSSSVVGKRKRLRDWDRPRNEDTSDSLVWKGQKKGQACYPCIKGANVPFPSPSLTSPPPRSTVVDKKNESIIFFFFFKYFIPPSEKKFKTKGEGSIIC